MLEKGVQVPKSGLNDTTCSARGYSGLSVSKKHLKAKNVNPVMHPSNDILTPKPNLQLAYKKQGV